MKKDLILLHGALGTKVQLEPLKQLLEDQFNVYSMNFEGHGDPLSNNDFSIAQFSENLKAFIAEHQLKQPNIFGYSMGGYVALFTEANQPGILGEIITLGTKFNWTPEAAAHEVRMLNPEIIEEKVPKFAQRLSKLHTPNGWKINMRKTADMMLRMGDTPPLTPDLFSKINNKVHLHVGSDDTMVSEEETKKVHDSLNNSSFDIIKDCEHPIEKVNPDVIYRILTNIL